MIKKNYYRFQPGAMSIIQMGEELIGHPTTAVSELVKNSYDADATKCRVYVRYHKNVDKSFLIVHDDGLGMDKNTLFGEWLYPSVSSKRSGDRRSKIFERSFLGSKGIGRLAAMALGRYMTVISKTYQDDFYNWISLDREEFKQDKLLEKIEFPGGKIQNYQDVFEDEEFLAGKDVNKNKTLVNLLSQKPFGHFKEGTLIVIEELDDTVRAIIEEETEIITRIEDTSIMKALSILITPLFLNIDIQNELVEKRLISKKYHISKEDSTFNLFVASNLFSNSASDAYPEFYPVERMAILKKYHYRVMGKVTAHGDVKGLYTCKRLETDQPEKEFNFDREHILSEREEKKREVKEIEPQNGQGNDTNVGEFFFDIRVYDRDGDAIDKLSKTLKTTGRNETKNLLNNLLGLRVSKNGFGVKPYGEEMKDWLGLGQMRVQDPANIPSTNQILGYVFLYSPQNDGLNEKTNREGFFENRAFLIFKEMLKTIIQELGKKRYHYRLKHNLGRTIKSKLSYPNMDAYIKYIDAHTEDEAVLKRSKGFVEEITTALDNMEDALTFSQRLASLGSGLELVYHELGQPLNQLGSTKSSLELKKNKIDEEKVRANFIKDISFLGIAISTIDSLRESLKPAIGRAKVARFKPIDTFKKVCILFKKDLDEKNIKLITDKSLENYEIEDYEYALWISFLNIINNAVYWLKLTDDARKITFKKEKGNTLVINNTGPEIPEEYIDLIFDYGVTLKKEKNATGLGLSFTRSILSSNDWEIWAENRDDGPTFLIRKVKEHG